MAQQNPRLTYEGSRMDFTTETDQLGVVICLPAGFIRTHPEKKQVLVDRYPHLVRELRRRLALDEETGEPTLGARTPFLLEERNGNLIVTFVQPTDRVLFASARQILGLAELKNRARRPDSVARNALVELITRAIEVQLRTVHADGNFVLRIRHRSELVVVRQNWRGVLEGGDARLCFGSLRIPEGHDDLAAGLATYLNGRPFIETIWCDGVTVTYQLAGHPGGVLPDSAARALICDPGTIMDDEVADWAHHVVADLAWDYIAGWGSPCLYRPEIRLSSEEG